MKEQQPKYKPKRVTLWKQVRNKEGYLIGRQPFMGTVYERIDKSKPHVA